MQSNIFLKDILCFLKYFLLLPAFMFVFIICFSCLVLAGRIPGTEEPGGLPSMGSHRVGHDWSDLAAAAAAVFLICLVMLSWLWIMFQKEGPASWSGYSPPTLFLGLFSVLGFFLWIGILGTALDGQDIIEWGLSIGKCCVKREGSQALRIPGCCCSVVQSCLTPCNPMDCSTPGFSVLHHLLELAQTYVHWVSDAVQPSHSLSSPSPPAVSLSQHQGLFQWVGSLHQMAKILELQSQHQSLQWILRIDFLWDWLVWYLWSPRDSQESLLQHHSSKASILRHSAFFTVQLSHPYMTTGKTIALTRQTFVDKVMSLLLNMLSRLLITFLTRSKQKGKI